MTADTVLIAALAGRGLSAAARRAGYLPLVIDGFGDTDTAEHAHAIRPLPDAARIGFRTKQLVAALDEFVAAAPSPPVGLVLGSGFEDRPKLVAALARRYRLIGNNAETIARTKSPSALAELMTAHAVAHPGISLQRPSDRAGWLSKRIGGCGGTHIRSAASTPPSSKRYYQQRLDGTPHSVLAVATEGRGTHVVGISRQWPAGGKALAFRYGGAVGPVRLDATAENEMLRVVHELSEPLGLAGLVSFDFLVVAGEPHLLEINPRPGATLDVFDDAGGALFRAHIAASAGHVPALPQPGSARAAGIFYADPAPLQVSNVAWPSWTADRPAAGSRIPRYRPVATVLAAGDTPDEALKCCRSRLDELSRMLYGQAPTREQNSNAETPRPLPQRVRPRRQAG